MRFFQVILFSFLVALCAWPQAAERAHIAGAVTGVDAQAGQVSIKTEQAGTVVFTVNDKTTLLRAPAGETDPKKFPKMAVSDIATGDPAVAYYRGALDQKPLIATSLVIRTKADLSQIAQKELADWKRRGFTGIVTSLDPAAKTITLKAGSRMMTVKTDGKTKFMRYSADSAKPSTRSKSKSPAQDGRT